MNDDTRIEALGDAYRRIRAPGKLAESIVAAAEVRETRRKHYRLPLAAAAAIAALVVLLPIKLLHESDKSAASPWMHIPLSRVQGQMPTMPSVALPSLGDIQGLPVVPSRHDLNVKPPETNEQPQTRLHTDPANVIFI